MKSFIRQLQSAATATLALLAGAALAQSGADQTTQFQARDGTQVTVHSGQPAGDAPSAPPPFDQLDTNHDGFIDQREALAYPALVNDFIHADRNRDGRISKAEYAKWH